MPYTGGKEDIVVCQGDLPTLRISRVRIPGGAWEVFAVDGNRREVGRRLVSTTSEMKVAVAEFAMAHILVVD